MPNSIEAAILLDKSKAGAYIVVEELIVIISGLKNKGFYDEARRLKIESDLRLLALDVSSFSLSARKFPAGLKINVAKNQYISKSPLMGLVGEYYAFGRLKYHLALIEEFLKVYFKLIDNYIKYSDLDYKKWVNGGHDKILLSYESSITKAAFALRENIALNSQEESRALIDSYYGITDDNVPGVAELSRIRRYSSGKRPPSKVSYATKTSCAIRSTMGEVESLAIVYGENDDIEVEQVTVEVQVPNFINSVNDLLKNQNKIKGRANQINKINQLRSVSELYLRPSSWVSVDDVILGNADAGSRALICLSLLTGRSLDFCFANYKSMVRPKGFITFSLNSPKVKNISNCVKTDNIMKISIPGRYKSVISDKSIYLGPKSIGDAKSAIKSLPIQVDVSAEKISKLFFYLANSHAGKTFAAMLFDSPLQTIMTQLHYSITDKNNLYELYYDIFNEFEGVLGGALGIMRTGSTEICGVANIASPCCITQSLDGFRKNNSVDQRNTDNILSFLLFSSQNGSRSVIEQSVDICAQIDQKVIMAIVNDKKIKGAQHARISILSRKLISDVFDLLQSYNSDPQVLKFTYIDSSGANILKPMYFSKNHGVNFSMNSIRKMRRSFLLNTKLSEEFIDALNGHHYVGTVPISTQSSLSLLDIYNASYIHIRAFSSLVRWLING